MTILVTGGNGFLGAWVIRRLRARGLPVRVFDLVENRRLVELIAGTTSGVEWVTGDIADPAAVRAAAAGTARIIHLAGLLTPARAADPARAEGHPAVVYTSGAAVFGAMDGRVPAPQTHYGAFKPACEGSARAYWADHGIASIGFRPYVVYGPGREGGASAGPSLACRAAARGERYTIPYSGRAGLVYADDAAAAYEAAVTRDIEGAHALTMAGTTASNEDIIAEIYRIIPDAQLDVAGPPMPIAATLDPGAIATVLPGLSCTSLADGIRQTIESYRGNPV